MNDALSEKNQSVAANILSSIPSPITDELHKGRYFTLPELPDKLLRAYDADTEGLLKAGYVRTLLAEFENTWGIPTVHPQFVVTGEERPEFVRNLGLEWSPELVVVSMSDRIADAVQVEDALKAARNDAEIAAEFESLDAKLLGYITNLFDQGGLFLGELTHYHQYVYSPGAKQGNRLVLVDVEPFMPVAIPDQHAVLGEERTAELLESLWALINNARQFESATGRPSRNREPIVELLDSLKPDNDFSIDLQLSLRELLDLPQEREPRILKLNDEILDLMLSSPVLPRLKG